MNERWFSFKLQTLSQRMSGARPWAWLKMMDGSRMRSGLLSPKNRRYWLRMNTLGCAISPISHPPHASCKT